MAVSIGQRCGVAGDDRVGAAVGVGGEDRQHRFVAGIADQDGAAGVLPNAPYQMLGMSAISTVSLRPYRGDR